ncbi:MAG: ABC transporter ATP-binding protein, partial [Pseudomonadota bacterium]
MRWALTLRIAEGGLAALNPLIAALAVRAVIMGHPPGAILAWAAPLLCLALAGRLWMLNLSSMRLHDLAIRTGRALRERVLRHFVTMPLQQFRRLSTGRTSQLLSQDLTWAESSAAHTHPAMLADLFTVVCLLAATCILFPPMGLSVILILAIGLGVLTWVGTRVQGTLQGHNEAIAEANREILEFTEGIEVIRSCGDRLAAVRGFDQSVERLRRSFDISVRKLSPLVAMMEAQSLASLAVAAAVGVHLTLTGHGETADLVAGLLLTLTMMVPLRAVLLAKGPLVLSGLAITSLREILAMPRLAEGRAQVPRTVDEIAFDAVTAGYGKTVAAKQVSFTARKGTMTALVGPSGAGKSTVFNLILRFLPLASGRITLNGQDISEMPVADYLNRIAVVFQESTVLDDTVIQNIRIGRPDATEADVIAAARAARIHERIMALPQGYKTRIGTHGGFLSGGERQRLTIARALLKSADIVLLDEATSALDPENERDVQLAFDELARDRMVFVIAHRLSTVVHADQ